MKLLRMSFITFLMAVALVFTSCTAAQQKYTINSAMTASELNSLKKQYVYVESLIRSKQTEFSEQEWNELLTVHATIELIISKVDSMVNLSSFDATPQEMSYLWRLAIDGYTRSRTILLAHWESFTPSQQIMLNTFDDHAKITNTRIDELLNDPDNAGINTSLILITGLASLALKLLLVL